MCTVQAPHRPVPQPNLVPVSLRPSRSTHNNGVAGGASVDAALPFTVKSMAIVSSLKNSEQRIATRALAIGCSPSTTPYVLRAYFLFATRYCYQLTQRRLDPRRVERQVADAFAGGVGKSIGNGGHRGALRTFARAERAFARTVDQLDLDRRRFRHRQDGIACPVARQNPAPVEAHLFLQRPAHRLHDAAFDLVDQPVRIDDQARIDRRPGPRHTHCAAATVDLDLRHHRYVAGEVLVLGEGDPAPARAVVLLARFPGG